MILPYSYDDSRPDSFEYIVGTTGISVKVGTALYFASGKLAIATGTTKPEYISMSEIASVAANQEIPVIRVSDDTVYETELSTASAAIALGAKYTLDATGSKITATTSGGVAEVVAYDGKAAGDKVRVRF